mmetsp:Transcript_47658/g.144113  ORF Transcript_47658/g.144113 Transcript_47658/m.144113 type:complete len:370 (-) Transcript_47658:132-1241(-)
MSNYLSIGSVSAAAATGAALYGAKAYEDHYEMFGSRKLTITDPGVINYPADTAIDMFNGLDVIGGEGTKYKEALKFLMKIEHDDKWKVITACTILLEKPTGVCLCGMTGPQKAKIRALDNRDKEAITGLTGTLKAFQPRWKDKDVGDDTKREVIKNSLQATQAYIWKEEIEGTIPGDDIEYKLTYRATAEQLDISNSFYKALVDNMKAELGESLVVGTHYASINYKEILEIREAAKNIRLKESVNQFLPKLTESERNNRSETEKGQMDKVRQDWPDYFKDVNVSRSKVIALLALQYQKKYLPVQLDWYKKYEGRPRSAKCPESVNSKTKEIWTQQMAKFKEEKEQYHKDASKKLKHYLTKEIKNVVTLV